MYFCMYTQLHIHMHAQPTGRASSAAYTPHDGSPVCRVPSCIRARFLCAHVTPSLRSRAAYAPPHIRIQKNCSQHSTHTKASPLSLGTCTMEPSSGRRLPAIRTLRMPKTGFCQQTIHSVTSPRTRCESKPKFSSCFLRPPPRSLRVTGVCRMPKPWVGDMTRPSKPVLASFLRTLCVTGACRVVKASLKDATWPSGMPSPSLCVTSVCLIVAARSHDISLYSERFACWTAQSLDVPSVCCLESQCRIWMQFCMMLLPSNCIVHSSFSWRTDAWFDRCDATGE